MEEVRNKISNGDRNPYIERLLVGLLGWDESSAEQSVVLLNVFYDNVDWQLYAPFKPVICEVGQEF